ncbi:hypothetical protein MJI24_25820, partial [Salmonella enterica subsp. enterica serovar Lubbock]|nr:hypothetical protein [Salmonella enterica subsp. enterica serovar Lubbock]
MPRCAIPHKETSITLKIVDTFSDAVKTVPLMGEDRNDNEYRRALALVEFLVDHDDLE